MQPRTIRRAGTAIAVSILLIGFGVAAVWLALVPGYRAQTEVLSGELASTDTIAVEAAPLLEGMKVAANFQFSQPRDPFRPLIVAGGVIITDGTSSGGGGSVTGTVVKLLDITDVGGELRAKVEVAGVEYDVGVGETFATNFKIVSLDADSAVILFGDNAFELLIGQEIIK
ncbi:MAG: hypothetical protein P1T08_18200 [Acidimicrobiia bacterium]|nr:hypothetical protein [Acidimicrobiia bacterium]